MLCKRPAESIFWTQSQIFYCIYNSLQMTSWYNGQTLLKPLDKLLITQPTLDKLLDYPDFIAQLKAFNSHLLEYLSQTLDLIRQAIQYIMIPPKQTDTQERKYKYPLLSTQMFQTEAVCLTTNFFKDAVGIPGVKTYLDYLYLQLDQPQLLELCAGYFYRVNLVLLNLKFKEYVDHMYSRPLVFKKLLNHAYNFSVTNTLQVILNLDNTKMDKSLDQVKNTKSETMKSIFSKIRFDTQGDCLSNLSNVLIEVIEKYYLIADGKTLLDVILEKQYIDLLFDLSQNTNTFINTPMLNVLLSIINYYSFSSLNAEDKDNAEMNKKNMERFDKQPLIQTLAMRFQRLLSSLTLATKFTTHHFKILEVLCHSISLSSNTLFNIIKKSRFFQSLLDLLFKHEECNIAHTLIERAFLHIFVSQRMFYEEHKLYLFCEMNIIKKTVSTIVGEKFQVLKTKPYFGHLMRIIKIYSNIQTTNEHIIHAIRQNSDVWGKVARDIIKPYEQVCSKDLGSYNIAFAPPLEYKVRSGSQIAVPPPRKVQGIDEEEDYFTQAKNDGKFKPQTSIFAKDQQEFRSSLGKDSNLKSFMAQVIQNSANNSTNSSTASTKKTVDQIYNQQKERQASQQGSNISKSSSQSNLSTHSQRKDSIHYESGVSNQRSMTPDAKLLKRVKVKRLDIPPNQRMYRKVDERDSILMNLLGIQY